MFYKTTHPAIQDWMGSFFYNHIETVSVTGPDILKRGVRMFGMKSFGTMLILGFHPANERCRYKVMPSLIG